MPVPTSHLRHRLLAPAVAAGLLLTVASAAQAVDPPDTTITSGPQRGELLLPGPVEYTFTSPDAGVTFRCKADDSPWTPCFSPISFNLAYGTHVFQVRAVDAAQQVDPTPAVGIWVVRNVACEQAGEAYRIARGKYFAQQHKLVKARRQLHRAHNHGTAAEFQQAKNKVRKVKAKLKKYKVAMDAALALEATVC